MKDRTFYRRCPGKLKDKDGKDKECNEISGFCLSPEEIKKDEKYICQNCQKEIPLSKWIISNENRYIKQLEGEE